MCQILTIKYICTHTRPMPAPIINLCEIKQLREKTTGKATTCAEIEVNELPCGNVCPECSKEISKVEKKFQIIERLGEAGYKGYIPPMPQMSTQDYMMWRTWRFDREKFRQLGVWGGDENGEIGQGYWSLKGWDEHSPFHPTKPGARSLRSEGGGFNSAFRWDPFLGDLSDINKPDNSGSGKGLQKLLGEDNPQVRMWELQLAAVLQNAGFVTTNTEEKSGGKVQMKEDLPQEEKEKFSFIFMALEKE